MKTKNLTARRRVLEEASIGIFDLMKKQGVSRAELAHRLGCSRPYVTQMLSGARNFTLTTLSDVYQALGRTPHWTLAPANDPFRSPYDEAASLQAVADEPRTAPAREIAK